MIDSSFWNRLRVKAVLDRYQEGFIELAHVLQDEYTLTNEQILGVIKMVDANKLSRLSAMWEKVEAIVPSFSNIPDSDYVGDIKEMVLGDAKKSGRLQVVTTLEVADGDYAGKTVKRFDGVEEETGMGYFKNLCEVIGLDLPPDLNAWQETMDAFVGDPNRIDLYDFTTKTTKGKEGQEYSNVYINGISEYTKGEGVAQEEVVQEEAQQEEVVQEEAPQEIVAPTRRAAPAKVAAQPVKATGVQPVRRVAAPAPVAPAPTKTAQPVRRTVPLVRK